MEIEKIKEAIIELENAPTTYGSIEKLRNLYTVKNGMEKKNNQPPPEVAMYSGSPGEAEKEKTEIEMLILKSGTEKAIDVFCELCEVLKIINPKLYAGVCRELQK